LFAVPVVQVSAPHDVTAWVERQQVGDVRVVGTDEAGGRSVDEHDFRGPTVLVVGNETSGMSAAWRVACTDLVSIPIGGGASSLNAASAGAVVLYEIARQRGFPRHADR
jgi:TrmH family RNA methyltransferase